MKRFLFFLSVLSVFVWQSSYSQSLDTNQISKKRGEPVADFGVLPAVLVCVGDTVTFVNKSSGNVVSMWDFGDGIDAVTNSNTTQLIHIYSIPTALVSLTVVSADGQESKPKYVSIRIEALPIIPIDQEDEVTILDGDSLKVSVTANEYKDYLWFNEKGDTIGKKQSIYLKTEGVYTVQAANNYGCKNKKSITVKIKLRPTSADGETIEVNNIITPNNDGYNDYLTVKNLEYYSNPCEIRIYNVWGDLIFSSSKYDNTWSGSNLDAGTYYYSITSKGRKGSIGFVNIIR